MTTIQFNYKDFLGQELENAVCKVVPQQPSLSGGEVRLNSPIFVSDGELLVLPIGIYTVTISGSYLKVVGYFEITTNTPDPTFISSILNIVTDASDIPSGTPISAIQGLQAELDSKLPINDPRLNNLLTTAERSKLAGIQNGATSNQTDNFLLTRTNHMGEQPISSITGLDTRLVSVESRNTFTNAERTKLTGIANNATQNATDAFLVDRANHTGTQPESSISGLSTRLTGIDTSITNLTARNDFTNAERTKLTGIATGATQNSTDAFLLSRANHTGTQAQSTITNLTTDLGNINSNITSLTARNIFTSAEQTKLAGIQTGATLNSSDATLLNRANHTGVQGISTITGLQTALDSRLVVTGTPTVNQVPVFNGTVVSWADQSGSVSGGVTSFNGRVGAITPQTSDYSSFYVQPNSSPEFNIVTANGGLQVNCAGSSQAAPRILGLSNLTAGTAARFQFGDAVNAIQSFFGGRLQMLGWHGIEFYGAHGGTTPQFNTGGGQSDFNVNIIATYPNHKLLSIRGLSNQTGNLFEAVRGSELVQSITPDGLTRFNKAFTTATLPSATANRGAIAYTSDGTNRLAFSDGTAWRELPDTLWAANRSNHTGTQPISSIDNLQSSLDSRLVVTGTPSTNQVPIFNGTSVVWGNQSGGVSSGVTTFNGRSGSITPEASDYSSFFIQPNTSPSLTNLNLTGNITIQNAGSNNRPVTLSTYSMSSNTEEGISLPMIRVTGGRMDFAPLDNKAEIRVSGSSTEFNIFNTSSNSFIMRVNSSGDNTITRDLNAGRNITATGNISGARIYTPIDTNLGTDTTGRIKPTNIADAALAINNGGTNWITVPSTPWVNTRANRAEFTFNQVAVPSSPANGDTWAEPSVTGGYNYWVWNSTRSAWMSMNLINVQSPTRWGLNTSQDIDLAVLEKFTGFWIERAYIKFLVANNNASNHFGFTLRNVSALSVNTDLGAFNTSSDTNNTALQRDIVTNSALLPWTNILGTRLIVSRVGTTAATNFTLHIIGRYYR